MPPTQWCQHAALAFQRGPFNGMVGVQRGRCALQVQPRCGCVAAGDGHDHALQFGGSALRRQRGFMPHQGQRLVGIGRPGAGRAGS